MWPTSRELNSVCDSMQSLHRRLGSVHHRELTKHSQKFCQKTNNTDTEYTKKHIEEAKEINPKVLKDLEEKVVVTENVKVAMEHIKKLHFLEIFALCQEMQKLTGISDEMMMSAIATTVVGGTAAPAQATGGAEAADAKGGPAAGKGGKPEGKKDEGQTFDIKLVGFPEDKKFHVLKEIRKLKPGMNLVESKKIIDEIPSKIGIKLHGEVLEEWKKALDAVGAKYEIE